MGPEQRPAAGVAGEALCHRALLHASFTASLQDGHGTLTTRPALAVVFCNTRAHTHSHSRAARKPTNAAGQKKKREKEKFFMLRPGVAPDSPTAATAAASPEAQLASLQAVFEGACEPGLVADVFASTGGALQAATEALLAMLSAADGGAASPAGEWQAGCTTHTNCTRGGLGLVGSLRAPPSPPPPQ
jgi:hypothetical protein